MSTPAYKLGSLRALQVLNVKVAMRRLTDPREDVSFYGDQDINEHIRLQDLQRELSKVHHTQLPDKSIYQGESGRAGGIGGGVLGGLGGATLGASAGGGKGALLGAAIGAPVGAGLGYFAGRGVGGMDHSADQNLQGDAARLLLSPQDHPGLLARMKTQRDQQLTDEQRQHELEQAEMNQQRFNVNYNV